MRKLMMACLALGLAASAGAKEGDKSLDVNLDIAGEPADGFGTAIGPNFGFQYDLGKQDIFVRGEVGYLKWSHSVSGVDVSYRRIPVTGGVRKYFTVDGTKLRPFAQGGLELSFDRAEAAVLGTTASDSDVNFGMVLGGGAELALDQNFSAQALFKYHVIDDGYWAFGFGGAYRF